MILGINAIHIWIHFGTIVILVVGNGIAKAKDNNNNNNNNNNNKKELNKPKLKFSSLV